MFQASAEVRALSADTLASILDQSVDCVKLIGLDGRVEYMNFNGQCAMEIDDVNVVLGKAWAGLWPEETRQHIADACASAQRGGVSRFDAFCPTAKGTPKWWNVSVSPIRDDDGAVTGIISISRDNTEAELARQALETSTAEMRHRLKNSYAMIGSLLTGFARGVPEREAFAREMLDRLAALGAAQTLFASRDPAPCQISELIPLLVSAFDGSGCPVTIESMCEAMVDQGRADAIALVLGELAVNSAKHGALGSSGQIRIAATEQDGVLAVSWSERSPRPVAAHARDGGQGLRLIDRIVRARRGTLVIDWAEFGLDLRILFPLA